MHIANADLQSPDSGHELLLGVKVHKLCRNPAIRVRDQTRKDQIISARLPAICVPCRRDSASDQAPISVAARVPWLLLILGLEIHIVVVRWVVVHRRGCRLHFAGKVQAQLVKIAHRCPSVRGNFSLSHDQRREK